MINEVAPPGFGHTKSGKGDKKGGTAAAFDRARKRGDFKGTKSQMFAIMWSQKNKGDKPHYKPGTDKKYKKYQDESFEIDKSAHKSAQKKAKLRNLAKGNENPHEKAAAEKKAGGPKLYGESKSGTMKKLAKASALDSSENPKDQDRARAMRVAADFKSWRNQKRKGKVRETEVVGSGILKKEEVVLEKDLNAAERRALPDKEFALPGKGKGPEGKQAGSYPIPDKTHARMALAMVAKHGTAAKKAKVRAAVAKKFPGIQQEAIETQAKDRKKLSQPHSVSGSRRDHSHDVDSALTDHVPRKGKGRIRPASKKEMRVSAMRDAGVQQEEVGITSTDKMKRAQEKAKRELIQQKAVEKQKRSLKGYSSEDLPDEKSSITRKEELTFEGWKDKAKSVMKKVAGKKDAPKHDYGRDAGAIAAKKLRKKDHEKVNFLDPDD